MSKSPIQALNDLIGISINPIIGAFGKFFCWRCGQLYPEAELIQAYRSRYKRKHYVCIDVTRCKEAKAKCGH